MPDIFFSRIHINGEIKKIGDEQPPSGFLIERYLQDVDAFHDQDIRLTDLLNLVGNNIVIQVRIDGSLQRFPSRLHPGQKSKEVFSIVTFGESLFV